MQTTLARTLDEFGGVRDLTRAYLERNVGEFARVAGIPLDIDAYPAQTFDNINAYLPPRGRLAMARIASGTLHGMAFVKPIQSQTAEIKRMYVAPAKRGTGLGRRLLTCLIDEAWAMGFASILLDSTSNMIAAHALYRSMGFEETDSYPESENDAALAAHLAYMRLDLRAGLHKRAPR